MDMFERPISDHKNDKSLPFSGGRSLREFSRLRRFECKFLMLQVWMKKCCMPWIRERVGTQSWLEVRCVDAEESEKKRWNIVSSSNGDDGSDGSSSTRSTTSPGRNDNPGIKWRFAVLYVPTKSPVISSQHQQQQ